MIEGLVWAFIAVGFAAEAAFVLWWVAWSIYREWREERSKSRA